MTNEAAERTWQELLAGNRRFLAGTPTGVTSALSEVPKVASGTSPIAVVVACVDSRVAPEILFDQPVGKLFVARVPGNVLAESVRWTLDIAMTVLQIPLVVVLGHTGCLAVREVVEGKVTGLGGELRLQVAEAAAAVRLRAGITDLENETIRENVRATARLLVSESEIVRSAVTSGRTELRGAVYRVEDGSLELLDSL